MKNIESYIGKQYSNCLNFVEEYYSTEYSINILDTSNLKTTKKLKKGTIIITKAKHNHCLLVTSNSEVCHLSGGVIVKVNLSDVLFQVDEMFEVVL